MLYEWELDHIATLDGWTAIFMSAGSFFGSLAVGLWTDLLVEGSPSEMAQRHGAHLQWWFAGIAALFFLFAFGAYRSRKSNLDRIKSQLADE